MADLHARLTAREELEASFESLTAQGIQASLDYIQVNVAPQIANLQHSITLAQEQIDQIIIGGKAPDTLKFGGQLPAYYATSQALSDGLAEKVPVTRKVNGKELSADFSLAKNDVGLGNVNNTADADKPVSTAQQTALDGKINGPKTLPAPGLLGRASDGEGAAEALTQPQARKLLGGWEFINSFDLTGLSILNIPGLDPFIALRMRYSVIMNAQGSFNFVYSSNGGTSFYADSDEHRWTLQQGNYNAVSDVKASQVDAGAGQHFPIGDHNATGVASVGTVFLHNFNKARTTSGECHCMLYQNGENRVARHIGDFDKRAIAMNALRLRLTVATTIQHGFLYLEGLRG
ncbi:MULTISPECIES: hypothetical protein [Agrobacterium tumefaciens complex]|uniref:hypothetical protein n=1 Tax=Agrobacterium tumefaciens complex TaxID=1183400 RepID=UPI0009B9AAC1|nr:MULTISPECIES: hypothetical protein [Agrobacterium tumefaciens complex]MBP2532613.1 hypothetical protein [Agrobacterium tumefaciens]